MTLSNLRDIVRRDPLLKSTDVISDANLNTLLNEGALDLSKRGKALILSATWSAVASTQTYVLSGASPKVSNFMEVYWPAGGLIYTQSSGKTKTAPNDFTFVSESWLDLNVPGWRDVSASDTLQYVYISFDSSGNLVLGVHPKSNSTTPSFKLYYVSRGTDMSADANEPWLNSTTVLRHLEPYHKGISWYAMWKLHETKTKDKETALLYKTDYIALAKELEESQKAIFSTEAWGLIQSGKQAAMQSFGGL